MLKDSEILDDSIEQLRPELHLADLFSMDMMVYICHRLNHEAGWWNDIETGELLDEKVIPIKLMLIVSELSEAMEADRKNLADDKLPHRPGFEVELADAIIRIFDLAGRFELDVTGAMIEKLAYNKQRADHKVENRQADTGKKY